MRIAFIINSLSYKSGTERVACHLANLFVRKLNYQVDILNRNTTSDNVAYYLNSNVSIITLTGNYVAFYQKIQKYIEENKPNFVIVHNMGRLSLLCTMLQKGKVKLISLEHVAFDSRPRCVKFFSKILYKNIHQVITLTYEDELSYTYWFKNVITVNNISPFSIPKQLTTKNRDVIAVGRLTYQKNFQALLQAWEQIQSRIENWTLKIYGLGEDFDELSDIIKSKRLKNVKLMGQANQIEEIYQQSSIFVMSSRFEGLPMVLIEAQTFGLPIISFDCPHGPAEVINHEKNGLLVENQNVEALAQAMFELMNDDKKRNQYSLQALKDAERFQENNILRLWRNILE